MIERICGVQSKIYVLKYESEGIKIARVRQTVKGNKETANCDVKKVKNKKWDKRLFRVLRKLVSEETIIAGNEMAMNTLDIGNAMFHLRKQEFQNGWEIILRLFQGKDNGNELPRSCIDVASVGLNKKRKSFMLILDSEKWKEKELIHILEPVMNGYEDIYVVLGKASINVERLTEHFFKEYGVELHLTDREKARSMSVDTMLLLLKEWEERYKCFLFGNGYVVAEWEKEMKRKARLRNIASVDNLRGLYSGFEYEIGDEAKEYEEALLFVNCYKMSEENVRYEKENPISVVAIYGVE